MAKIYESLVYQDNTPMKERRNLVSRTSKRRQSHIQRSEESVTSYSKVMVAQTIKPLLHQSMTI